MPDVIKPGPPNNGGGADGGGEDEQENGAVTMDLMGSGRDFPLQEDCAPIVQLPAPRSRATRRKLIGGTCLIDGVAQAGMIYPKRCRGLCLLGLSARGDN
ncbi:unnamed protein product [Ectocarpus sp. 13 AM-2016]